MINASKGGGKGVKHCLLWLIAVNCRLIAALLPLYCRFVRSGKPMNFAATGLFRTALDLRAAMTSNSGSGAPPSEFMLLTMA